MRYNYVSAICRSDEEGKLPNLVRFAAKSFDFQKKIAMINHEILLLKNLRIKNWEH